LARGRIKSTPEDFVVEELPLYEPSGEGEHLYIRFTKRGLTTDAAVKSIASALGVGARDVGVAGMKDKVAVTTQTISVPIPPQDRAIEERARALALDGITVHEARRHGNKLRTGHLIGNRFAIVVRGVAPEERAQVIASLERIAREGLPNAFGTQRFGRDRDNADRARAWLSGRERGPRDLRMKRLLWSALQSELFNEVLQRRVDAGTWATPLEGDLLKRHASGGLFVCTDVQTDRARALEGELSPTGPMFGVKMREPEGAPRDLERAVLAERLGEGVDLAITKPFGEGSRRTLRLWVEALKIESPSEGEVDGAQAAEQASSITVRFVLPKGAYATTVLSAAISLRETENGETTSGVPASADEPREDREEEA
jgi:tRNA pseudouridine13 synthase